MKYIIIPIVCILLFTQCHRSDDTVQPTGTNYDTLSIHWTKIEATNIVYYFQDYSTQSAYASDYISQHESAYTTINNVFNAKMPQKLRFFIWSDANLAQQLLGRSLGFTDPVHCVCYVRPNQSLGHEMTHAITYWAWGVEPTVYSRFVNEGVAVAFDLNSGNRIDEAKSALAGTGIHSVTDLWSGSYQNASENIFYPVAGAFIDFLYKQNKVVPFDSLIKNQTQTNAETLYGAHQLDSLITSFNGLVGL